MPEPSQLLYDAVKVALKNSKNFKSQLQRLECILTVLDPDLVEQLRINQSKLRLPGKYVEKLQQKMIEGLYLLNKLSSVSCLNWNVWGSSKYARQLEELIGELEVLQQIIQMQNSNLSCRNNLLAEATERIVSEVLRNQRGLNSRVADLEKVVFGNERNNPQLVDLPMNSILRGALRRAASCQFQVDTHVNREVPQPSQSRIGVPVDSHAFHYGNPVVSTSLPNRTQPLAEWTNENSRFQPNMVPTDLEYTAHAMNLIENLRQIDSEFTRLDFTEIIDQFCSRTAEIRAMTAEIRATAAEIHAKAAIILSKRQI